MLCVGSESSSMKFTLQVIWLSPGNLKCQQTAHSDFWLLSAVYYCWISFKAKLNTFLQNKAKPKLQKARLSKENCSFFGKKIHSKLPYLHCFLKPKIIIKTIVFTKYRPKPNKNQTKFLTVEIVTALLTYCIS